MSTASVHEVPGLAGLVSRTTASPLTIGIVVMVLALLIHFFASPRLDPREPPELKPRIPFVGHIIGLFRHQASYYSMLQ